MPGGLERRRFVAAASTLSVLALLQGCAAREEEAGLLGAREAEGLGRQDATMAGDQHAGIIHQHRHVEAEFGDGRRQLRHLLGGVHACIRGIGRQRRDRSGANGGSRGASAPLPDAPSAGRSAASKKTPRGSARAPGGKARKSRR